MSAQLELLVTEGPLQGRRFSVPAAGLRLGRSSSCEISIPDPVLSRNHCLFETRDGGLWVTDLQSANGTVLNGAPLGSESRPLKSGDKVFVGDSVLQAVAAGADAPAGGSPAPKIDLGLGGGASAGDASPAEDAPKQSWQRYVLWGVALASVVAAALLIALPVTPEEEPVVEEPQAVDMGALASFTYESVKATPKSIYRYALAYDGKSLHVEVHDVPEASRHVKESAELSADARARLSDILSSPEIFQLAPEYVGNPSDPGTLKSFSLHVIRATRVLDVSIENASEPEAFLDVRLICLSRNDTRLPVHLRGWIALGTSPMTASMRTAPTTMQTAESQSSMLSLQYPLHGLQEPVVVSPVLDTEPDASRILWTERVAVADHEALPEHGLGERS